jgi:hypothetical protein
MRTIAALDGKVRRAVDLRRHGGIRGRKKLSEPLAVAAMHGRDHAQQTRIGRGIRLTRTSNRVEVRLTRLSKTCSSGGTVTISGA